MCIFLWQNYLLYGKMTVLIFAALNTYGKPLLIFPLYTQAESTANLIMFFPAFVKNISFILFLTEPVFSQSTEIPGL